VVAAKAAEPTDALTTKDDDPLPGAHPCACHDSRVVVGDGSGAESGPDRRPQRVTIQFGTGGAGRVDGGLARAAALPRHERMDLVDNTVEGRFEATIRP
jgi:hypothetical protein